MEQTKIITIANRKGGVGKTTACVTIGHGLARMGKKVLLIDMDPQASLGEQLGIKGSDAVVTMLSLDMTDERNLDFVRSKVVKSGRQNLWVLPGNSDTKEGIGRWKKLPPIYLRDALERLFFGTGFHYIIIDTMPSEVDGYNEALWAADLVLIPIHPTKSAIKGVSLMWDEMKKMVHHPEPAWRWKGRVLGILVNEFEAGRKTNKQTMEALQKVFPEQMILGPIQRLQIFRQLEGREQTLWEEKPLPKVADDYQRVIDCILGS